MKIVWAVLARSAACSRSESGSPMSDIASRKEGVRQGGPDTLPRNSFQNRNIGKKLFYRLEDSSEKATRGCMGDRRDAIVVADGQRPANPSVVTSLSTFLSAPCLKQSLGLGLAGGAGLCALRFATSRNALQASTWGAVVGGLLAGTNWFVCRRAFYSAAIEEQRLLQRVQANEPEALKECAPLPLAWPSIRART